jgi:hypothetical protein
MPLPFYWQSDGIVARVALVLCGVVFLVLVLRRFRRERVIARLLPAAVLWHFMVWALNAFWLFPYYVSVTGVDCYGYHHDGITIAKMIRSGDWASILWGWNTAAMPIITGFLYVPFGGDIYGVLFFSAVLGLCGGLYFCRAFGLWARPAQMRRYALIILFLPSFVIWTSSFGKDSWMALGLGLAAYGYSSVLKLGGTGLWHLLAGVAITTVVRPHVAVTLAASMALAYVWGLTRARHVSILVKVQMVVALIAMLALLASVARGFLKLSDVSAESLQEYGESRSARNATGGSAVEIGAAPGLAGTLVAFPRGIVRVLFQPFPWEVHSVSAGMAAGENLFILWFVLSHLRRLRPLLRGMVREPYVLFSSILASGLLLMFSLTPNLGLLSRERAQLLPFLFGLLVTAEAVRKRGTRLARMTARAGWPYSQGRTLSGTQTALPSKSANCRIPPSPLRTHGHRLDIS